MFIKYLKKFTSYTIQDVQDAFSISSLVFVFFKAFLFLFSYKLIWYNGILLYFLIVIASIITDLNWKMVYTIIAPFFVFLLGDNHVRYHSLDFIPDAYDYHYHWEPKTKFQVFYFFLFYKFQKYIGRPFYTFLVFFQFLFLRSPILFIVVRRIVFIMLIFNQMLGISIILSIMLHISKQITKVSFRNSSILYLYFKKKHKINLKEMPYKINKHNLKIIEWWTMHKLEKIYYFKEKYDLTNNKLSMDYLCEKSENYMFPLFLFISKHTMIIKKFF